MNWLRRLVGRFVRPTTIVVNVHGNIAAGDIRTLAEDLARAMRNGRPVVRLVD